MRKVIHIHYLISLIASCNVWPHNVILTGKYDMVAAPNLDIDTIFITRQRFTIRLQKSRTRYDLHKFFFANRVVNMWNSLLNNVVHTESTNLFKTRLDKFCSNQEIYYDYHAELYGTRS